MNTLRNNEHSATCRVGETIVELSVGVWWGGGRGGVLNSVVKGGGGGRVRECVVGIVRDILPYAASKRSRSLSIRRLLRRTTLVIRLMLDDTWNKPKTFTNYSWFACATALCTALHTALRQYTQVLREINN